MYHSSGDFSTFGMNLVPSIDCTVAQALLNAVLEVVGGFCPWRLVIGLIFVCFGGNWNVHNDMSSHFSPRGSAMAVIVFSGHTYHHPLN